MISVGKKADGLGVICVREEAQPTVRARGNLGQSHKDADHTNTNDDEA